MNNKTVLKDEIDMSKVELFLIHIYYITGEDRDKLEIVAVEKELDIKKLINALRSKAESVVLESRIKTMYDTEDVTAEYIIPQLKVEEIKIVAVLASEDIY